VADDFVWGKGANLSTSCASIVTAGAGVLDRPAYSRSRADSATSDARPAWYAIWTRSHCEQLVSDQLMAKGFKVFLPKTSTGTVRRGVRRESQSPLFPGYLFVHHAIDKHTHTEIIKARGVVRILGERWDRLATIDDDVMSGLQRVIGSGEPVQAHANMLAGARVRVLEIPS
jgi:transcription antitermination factor NusG